MTITGITPPSLNTGLTPPDELGRSHPHPGLMEDIEQGHYFV